MCLVVGGERLVTGAARLARYWGLPTLLIGVTIVAIGTSAPELLVSIMASFEAKPGIAVGNALGSNISNIGLVIGFAALIRPINVLSKAINFEFAILFILMLISVIVFNDGNLTFGDGCILLACFLLCMIAMTWHALKQPLTIETTQKRAHSFTARSSWLSLGWLMIGVLLLPLGSELLIKGATGMARNLGISELMIGLTIVSIGTSLPELMASLMGVIKREDDIALGNIIGSNIFNLGILSFPAMIAPFNFGLQLVVRDFGVMLVITLLFYLMCRSKAETVVQITRSKGALLIFIYLCYFALLISK